jgi:hypothetical protein
MKKERSNTKILLIDIQFYESLNEFEYQFGESITYKQMEQKSYIDFKEIMFDSICREIKFRKFGRLGKILTIKAEMLKIEIDKFKQLLENDKIQMSYGWVISNVTLIKDEKINEKNTQFKKLNTKDFEEDEEDEEDEISIDEIDSFDDY